MSLENTGASASPAALFFEDAWKGFEIAAVRKGSVEKYLDSGGKGLRLSFAGPALARRIGDAFSHLEAPALPGAFHIRIWDSSEKGLPVINPPFPIPLPEKNAAVHLYREGGIRIACFVSPEGISFSLMDVPSSRGIFWLPDADGLLYGDYASPLLTLLSWWLADTGRQMIHGAAVGSEKGGVLIGGSNGAGKTTLSLSCLTAGLGFGGDDRMALEESGGSIVAHSLYSSVKLGEKTMAWFPEIAACAADYTRPGPKTICLLHPAFRGGISSRIAVNALVFPAVDPALKEPFLEPLSSGESFRRLVPSTILQMPGAAPSDMSFLVRLCRRLPGYVLHLGSRRDAAVALVGRLIANKGSLPLPGTAA